MVLANTPQKPVIAAAAQTLGAPVSSALKTAFIAVGVPIATWCGIAGFWSYLRWTGEAPTYYVGSMVGLRGLLAGPIQLVTMVVLGLTLRATLARTSWIVLGAAGVVAGVFAITGDAIGMHFFRGGAQETAHDIWDWAPHLVGPAVVLLIMCHYHGRPPQQRMSAPSGVRSSRSKTLGIPRHRV